MEAIIDMQALSYKSGYTYLLHDINWQVQKGEHWVVFGLNGSGKTTLLSTIAGYRRQTHGTLRVFGESYSEDNVFDLRKRIGWVSSSFFDKYMSNESALSIVLSGLSGTLGLSGQIGNEDVMMAQALLRQFGLGEKIDYPFDVLSKGERQNVLIARALLPSPDILIMDEPSTGLDVLAKEYMLSVTRELAEKTGITLIYVTHYAEEIQPLFAHTLLLKRGRVYKKGLTDALFCDEVLSSFLDHPVHCEKIAAGYSLHADMPSTICDLLARQTLKGGEHHGH